MRVLGAKPPVVLPGSRWQTPWIKRIPLRGSIPAQYLFLDQNLAKLWPCVHVTSESAVSIQWGTAIPTVMLDFSEVSRRSLRLSTLRFWAPE
jgi:hypothetical protein